MSKKPATRRTVSKPVFHVYIAGETGSYVLQDLKEETFCGIQCVSGKFAKPDVRWLYRSVIRIPADKITLIAEFKSLDDYRKRLETAEDD